MRETSKYKKFRYHIEAGMIGCNCFMRWVGKTNDVSDFGRFQLTNKVSIEKFNIMR
jgi:hypothetical protein